MTRGWGLGLRVNNARASCELQHSAVATDMTCGFNVIKL